MNEALIEVSQLSYNLFYHTNDLTLFDEVNKISEESDAETYSFEMSSPFIQRL